LAYSLNENSEPIFTFNDSQTLQDLKSGSNMFASNPTELIINNDSYFLDSILSGDTVNETIIGNNNIIFCNKKRKIEWITKKKKKKKIYIYIYQNFH